MGLHWRLRPAGDQEVWESAWAPEFQPRAEAAVTYDMSPASKSRLFAPATDNLLAETVADGS
jgi:hypothetical protein